MEHLINILVRTSHRPKYFDSCMNSILEQSYSKINVFVSVDDDFTEEYVRKYEGVAFIRVQQKDKKLIKPLPGTKAAPYNLYLNELNSQVDSGWILYLDDDDRFSTQESLQKIVSNIKSKEDLLLWRVRFPDRLIPEDKFWEKKPTLNHFSMIGFMYHSSYKNYIKFDASSGGDYRAITQLWDNIPNKVWINKPLTGLQRSHSGGGKGRRDDKN